MTPHGLPTVLVLAGGLLWSPLPAIAQTAKSDAPSIDWRVEATPKRLERLATITLKDAKGEPISGARIEVNVDMPSMPMMHKVPMTVADPAPEPGTYRALFTVEMAGEWAARIEVKQPMRSVVVRKFKVD